MRPPVAVNRWLVQHPVAVDRLLVAGGFVLGAIAFVNGAREGVLLLNVLGALLAGGAIAAIFAWSRRRQRGREEQARRVVIDERLRIARELHDVVAHHVSVMGVQAAGARRILDKRPDQAAEALEAIESASRQAVVELQRLLGVLRSADGSATGDGRPGVGQLAALATSSRETGLPVELLVEGIPPDSLPATLDLSIYRIVQEALTNAIKHGGPGTRAEVRVRFAQRSVELVVSDDGAGSPSAHPAAPGSGRGLVGMRERVALFGGELTASPRPEGGFAVRALLPMTRDEGLPPGCGRRGGPRRRRNPGGRSAVRAGVDPHPLALTRQPRPATAPRRRTRTRRPSMVRMICGGRGRPL